MERERIVCVAILMLLSGISLGQETTVVYDSADTPIALPESGTTTSTIFITDAGVSTRPSIRLNLSHGAVEELEASLISPDGTRVKLFANVGAGGTEFINTWFFDNAATPIAEGEAPFSGGFRPEDSLTAFDFKNIEGAWTLEIRDGTPGNSGTLNSWKLVFRIITSNLYFEDTFASATFDEWNWIDVDGATVDSLGFNNPSGKYSLRLNGHPNGGDSITSRAINLSGCLGATFTYSYERTAHHFGTDSPEKGEDLIIAYRVTGSGAGWVELDRQPGSGPDMTHYEQVRITLPPEALHRDCYFQIRRADGTVGPYDDWFVDDVKIELVNRLDYGVVMNPSFEGQVWGWDTDHRTSSSALWQSDGDYSARTFTYPRWIHEAETWIGLSQNIDLSGVAAIRFDASTTTSSGGTWEHCAAAVCIDEVEVWSDAGTDKTWLDVLIDTADYTGEHSLSLRLKFLETGYFDEDLHYDNIRVYLGE